MYARAGDRVDEPVSIVDVTSTVAALTGLESRERSSGSSLLDPTLPGDRRLDAESLYGSLHFGWGEMRSLIDSRYHYIDSPRAELFDLGSDPREMHDASGRLPDELRGRRRELKARSWPGPQRSAPATREEIAALTALGYLSATSNTPSTGPRLDPKDGLLQLEALTSVAMLRLRGAGAQPSTC